MLGVPDSVAAAGQDSPGAEHLAYFAAHVSAHPSCPELHRLGMLGHRHTPCPSPRPAFLFQPIWVKM